MSKYWNPQDLAIQRAINALGRFATTLDEAVDKCLQDLELTDSQADRVASRQKSVRERVELAAKMDIAGSKLIGSYARSTQIRSLKQNDLIDVDSLLILKANEENLRRFWHTNDGGSLLLEELRRALSGYQGLTVTIERPAVTLTWSDMKMEIVPAFPRKDGGYLIPSSSFLLRDWQATDPIGDAERFTEINKATNGEFKPTAKLLKCWNRSKGGILRSFPLECVLYHSVDRTFQEFKVDLRQFFRTLRALNGKTIRSPAGIGNLISINLSPPQLYAVALAEDSLSKALFESSNGNDQLAIRYAAAVFGAPFQGAQ